MKRCKRMIVIVMLLCLLCGCAAKREPQAARYQKSYLDVFDTVTLAVLYDESPETADAHFAQLYEKLSYYHRLFDIYHAYEGVNNLYAVNANAGRAPVAVDAAMLELLQLAKDMYALTGGRVNVAMGSVLSLWHDCREQGLSDPANAALPDMAELREAARHTDLDKLIIDTEAGTAYLVDPDMRLDVGAIAKGFAAQRVMDELAAVGVKSMLLSVGGNVCARGMRGDGALWQVAVESPDMQGTFLTLAIADQSLVTSGSYQRYYTIDGVRYHHIIDPETLLPSTYFASVTVLSGDSGIADALSTALFNMPLEKGRALIESLDGVEALWLDLEGNATYSSGFAAYVAQG